MSPEASGIRYAAPANGIRDSGSNVSGSAIPSGLLPGWYTLAVDLTMGEVAESLRLSVQASAGILAIGQSISTSYFPLAAGESRRLFITFQVIAQSPSAPAMYVLRDNANLASNWLVRNVGIYTGRVDPGLHCDGDTPGWRWLGAVNASESAGYPYTLESIVGSPLADITRVGSSGELPLGQLEGRSTYLVVERTAGMPDNTSVVFGNVIPATANVSGFVRTDKTSGTSRYTFRPQFQGGGGAAAVYALQSTEGVVGMNVLAIAVSDNMTNAALQVNGGIPSVTRSGMDGGQGYPTSGISTADVNQGGTVYEKPWRMLHYRGFHNEETRRRVSAWLARKYGTPIPAGY